MQKQKKKSIRKRIILLFVSIFVLTFIVNTYLYYNLNQAISRIDNVYSSNIKLNDFNENLDHIQTQLYEYLNTKNSEALENYYVYESDYRELIKNLNQKPTDNVNKLMEKNIYEMSLTYLEKTSNTIEAKRGRNISKYKEGYLKSKELYGYLQANINSLNETVFLYNAHNYSVLREILNYILVFSVVILTIIMIMAIFWGIIMTRNITKPLVELAQAAHEIASGNMDVDFPIVETEDEVAAVAKACNKMIGSIRDYIEKTRENYERESQLKENELIMKNDLKEAQLRYLQAQINPHFLFNSLNAGAQLAMMEGAERACMFIQNMADFFRYNVRKSGKETTLLEELQLIDSYIYVMNVRFSGEINYETSVDERCLEFKMPAMVLQPIVENALNHGIKGMEGKGVIKLSIYREAGRVLISIKDNGVGISDEMVKKIMNDESIAENQGKEGAGVGMENIKSRLKNYYNEEDVFAIKSTTNGTEVILFLPLDKGATK